MTLTTLWLFVGMTFFVSATPGPNMLYVMSTSVRHGLQGAMAAMAGCMTALLIMLAVSAAGLGALLQAFPTVFDTLRLVGAAYLAYLGVQCWRSPVPEQPQGSASVLTPTESAPLGALYRRGFLVAASNPKAILFAAAFFPQFIHADAPALPQFVMLMVTFSVIEIAWYFVYAASGQKLSAYLQRATVMRAFNRATGGVFVGFGALMALVKE